MPKPLDLAMHTVEIYIRSSEWRDRLDSLLRLQKAAYRIESQLIRYPTLPPLFETTQDLIDSDERFLICRNADIAPLDHKTNDDVDGDVSIVGVLSFEPTAHGFHIDRLVVEPKHFGNGIASHLLAAIEAIALRERQPQLSVSTAALNQPAVRLYQKAGYRKVSQRTLPDGLVLVRFEKLLT